MREKKREEEEKRKILHNSLFFPPSATARPTFSLFLKSSKNFQQCPESPPRRCTRPASRPARVSLGPLGGGGGGRESARAARRAGGKRERESERARAQRHRRRRRRRRFFFETHVFHLNLETFQNLQQRPPPPGRRNMEVTQVLALACFYLLSGDRQRRRAGKRKEEKLNLEKNLKKKNEKRPRGRPAGDARAHPGGGQGDRQQVSIKSAAAAARARTRIPAEGSSLRRHRPRFFLVLFVVSLVAHPFHRPRTSTSYPLNHRAADTRAERYGEERHPEKEEK